MSSGSVEGEFVPATQSPTSDSKASSAASSDGFSTVGLLSALTGATQRHLDLLRIITDPANIDTYVYGETHDEVATSYEDFDGYLGDHEAQVRVIADALATHYKRAGAPEMTVGFESDSNGQVHGYNMFVSLPAHPADPFTLCVAVYCEIESSTTDRNAKGLAAAVAIAEAIDDQYQRLVERMRARMLLDIPQS